MSKTVYFLGAGATKAVAPDAPLNKDLVPKALASFREEKEAVNIQEFINDLIANIPDAKTIIPNIQNKIWDLLDYIIQEGKSISRKYNIENIIELKRDLLHIVIKEFQRSLENIDVDIYRKFVERIKNEDVAIISTNYDIIIDKVLFQFGLNYGTKMRNAVGGDFEIAANLTRPTQYIEAEKLNIGKIMLLKIHGSLNWLYCAKCNEIDITIDKGVIKTLTGDYYCHNRNCTNRYEPLLITPTMFKNYENRFIKETWSYAERKLTEAENITFIGYSLKEDDYQIRCLLMKALLSKSIPYRNITVIERKDEGLEDKKYLIETIEKKYQDLYGKIDFKTIGFKEYVEKLS